MKLKYKDIRLRKLQWSDAKAIYEYARLDSVSEYTQEEVHRCIGDTYDSIENYHMLYKERKAFPTMVIEYEDNVVGLVSLHTKIMESVYEIGFELNPRYHNKKIMSQVLEFYIPYMVKKYKIRKIVAEVLKVNKVSIHLLEKNGFVCVSENKKEKYYERKFINEKI